ncbi:hypothetical protein LCGC14_2380990 [marine sediment metagenome]|uniref:Uncharacterized protein n=1 Tax=marine sediment metagenome TaxID=412755 RepID=A0A0F9EDD3_9ZZZZ
MRGTTPKACPYCGRIAHFTRLSHESFYEIEHNPSCYITIRHRISHTIFKHLDSSELKAWNKREGEPINADI